MPTTFKIIVFTKGTVKNLVFLQFLYLNLAFVFINPTTENAN